MTCSAFLMSGYHLDHSISRRWDFDKVLIALGFALQRGQEW